ncbi:MAG: hypothetical protein JW986_10510 [Methanotrichaceae archaeon]|nr:hypothetical protein [Methanotrichaceae archaeon]
MADLQLDGPLALAFAAALILGAAIGSIFCYLAVKDRMRREYKLLLREWRMQEEKRIRSQALNRSRAVLKGKIGEQMAPLLPEFRYNPADARFIGSPVDYVIFDGYSEALQGQGRIERIVLLDVKTGRAKLSPVERKVEEAVASGRVAWETLELG